MRIRKKSLYVCASRQVANILRYIMCRRRVSLLVPKPHGSLQEQGSSILFALKHKHSHRVLPLPSAAKARHTSLHLSGAHGDAFVALLFVVVIF